MFFKLSNEYVMKIQLQLSSDVRIDLAPIIHNRHAVHDDVLGYKAIIFVFSHVYVSTR